jgi:hypothetical protein
LGLSGTFSVKSSRGELDEADISSLPAPCLERKISTSSSLEGWCTFSTLQPVTVSDTSFVKK